MLHKTQGIVFKYFKYGDTSVVVKIFTAKFGLQTYIVNGVRSKSSKGKIALFQPLTLLDMVVYYKENKDINRISEMRCSEPFQSVTSNIRKTAVAMFLSEVMYKSIKEEGDVTELFEFLHNAIILFDHLTDRFENFHLQFLLKLSKFLGFGVETREQLFNTLDTEEKSMIKSLSVEPFEKYLQLSNSRRRKLLDFIIRFYQSNIDTIKEINSIKILQEVL